jgi:GT2 family glycosyltransferase
MNEIVSERFEDAGTLPHLRVGIGIATSGRPEILNETLQFIALQSELPEKVVICPVSELDINRPALNTLPYPVSIAPSASGLTIQRNIILSLMTDFDVVIFFDDDFMPDVNYIANARALLQSDDGIVLATGVLLDDGIHGPGIDPADAKRRLLLTAPQPHEQGRQRPYYGVYGCNMAARLSAIREAHLQFDEQLPLYGWQEDIDFSRQMAPHGQIIQTPSLTGIHLGTKRGRTSGLRFGYSQVANPIYLMRKGTMSLPFGFRTMTRNIVANIIKSFRPEAYIDRRGRFTGNLLALFDFVRGHLHPRRILEIEINQARP